MRVVSARRLSSSFVRVSVRCSDPAFDATYAAMGYDQWFRLFFPAAGCDLALSEGDPEGWYTRLLGMDERTRPAVRNYTVREARREHGTWRIDIDFVVHTSPETGRVEGVAASWALAARPGDVVGFLDQGTIFTTAGTGADGDGAPVVIVSDESGLPGVEGIARSLPAATRAAVLLEVPHADDRRPLESRADLDVRWAVREGAAAGVALLEELDAIPLDPRGYVYIVGESAVTLKARRRALRRGMPKASVDFCGYWRPERRRAAS
ncbi:siderophore-interacting protein [Brachybacterium huguangmaarense]|uniref:Siderophore-interacting protein n=1 Tax=Brachybacterium huguangmaarense TaxID=1652028 RepID=A0ABY6G4E3_9MICO|nr:siderophore-interacting protein [Brachybacterium huguangmaarense]UYG17982.1 siderophore-interacting protein [Brachybacterium huguangmaarense]